MQTHIALAVTKAKPIRSCEYIPIVVLLKNAHYLIIIDELVNFSDIVQAIDHDTDEKLARCAVIVPKLHDDEYEGFETRKLSLMKWLEPENRWVVLSSG